MINTGEAYVSLSSSIPKLHCSFNRLQANSFPFLFYNRWSEASLWWVSYNTTQLSNTYSAQMSRNMLDSLDILSFVLHFLPSLGLTFCPTFIISYAGLHPGLQNSNQPLDGSKGSSFLKPLAVTGCPLDCCSSGMVTPTLLASNGTSFEVSKRRWLGWLPRRLKWWDRKVYGGGLWPNK